MPEGASLSVATTDANADKGGKAAAICENQYGSGGALPPDRIREAGKMSVVGLDSPARTEIPQLVDEAVLDCVLRDLDVVLELHFLQNAAAVNADRLRRKRQRSGHLREGFARSDHQEGLIFPV